MTSALTAARTRLDGLAADWNVAVEHVTAGERALLAFGLQGDRPVVLKVSVGGGEERYAAGVLGAFDGRGAVRVFAHASGAWLLERAMPGHSLEDVVAQDGDDEATRLLASAIGRMSPGPAPRDVPTVGQWGQALELYQASGDVLIPGGLVASAVQVYRTLAGSQRRERLLHGDLHHGNVLFDRERGWLAIDPKGVVGELEFELGAALRNPWNRPSLVTDPERIRHRVRLLADALDLDASRLLGWTFAQAVLAAVWMIEDDGHLDRDWGCVALAEILRPSVEEWALET